MKNLFRKKSEEQPKIRFTSPNDFRDQMVKTMDELEEWGKKNAHQFTTLDEEMEHFALSTLPKFANSSEDDEEWRVIPGFPDYIINEKGIVRGMQSLMDMPLWVRLWRDDNHEEHHTTEYLVGLTFRGLPPEKPIEPKAEDFKPQEEKTNLICKHCFRAVKGVDGSYIHDEGLYRGKARCDPQDSQLVYGYNADPVGAECSPICLGHNE